MGAPIPGTATGARCVSCRGPMLVEKNIGHCAGLKDELLEHIVETRCSSCGWCGREYLKAEAETEKANVDGTDTEE